MGVSRTGASVAHPRSLPLQARSKCLGGSRIAATTLQEPLIATLTAPRLHEGSISHRMTSRPSAPASNLFLRPCLISTLVRGISTLGVSNCLYGIVIPLSNMFIKSIILNSLSKIRARLVCLTDSCSCPFS